MERDVGLILKAGVCVALIVILVGMATAGIYDLNPGKYAIKHKNTYSADVEGEGYVMVYQKVDTNNLSLDEYMHGSGTFDEADKISSEQKSTGSPSSDYYWIYDDYSKTWKKKPKGANSVLSFTKQNEMTYSPVSFPYGTGYYAEHPVTYNSLLKDKTVAKSYQEGASMHHQVEYARGFIGDITVDMNCTGPLPGVKGTGLLSMKLNDDVTMGTVHVGELYANPVQNKFKVGTHQETYTDDNGDLQTRTVTDYGYGAHDSAWNNPLIEIDANYIGNFKIQKEMTLEIRKSYSTTYGDWLPCCSGGFFDIPGYDVIYADTIGIFDCTCRNTSLSTYQPAWNGSTAQFPNDVYASKP